MPEPLGESAAGRKGRLPPPLPVTALPALTETPVNGALDYYRPPPQGASGQWAILTRLRTTAEWHQARAALARGYIESLMGDGEDISSTSSVSSNGEGIALLVPEGDVPRARLILDAVKDGFDWCPRCGSTLLDTLPLPWWWMIWSVLFLGIAPFSPPRFRCRACGHRWE